MSPDRTPLCVDLDGTLLRTDTLVESLLVLLREKPWLLLCVPLWLLRGGKAHAKREIARRVSLDIGTLPLHQSLLHWLQEQHRGGRRLMLVTAADRSIADAMAAQLPLFERVYASDGTVNLSRTRKRDRLVADFGEQGYDYAGNAWADLPVWHDARQAIVVSRSVTLLARARAQARVAQVFADTPPRLLQWPRALRMHQWIKNLLLFLPLLLSQKFTEPKLLLALWGFAAFCLCASSVYLLNDLLDMPSDRLHPRKRLRPFASGELPALDGLLLAPLLLGMALVIALEISRWFTSVLLVYYASTLAYSMYLKRIPLIDVMLLAGLYTLRIVAGAAAIGVPLTFWLLAFSMFLFLSLGTMKRYTELAMVRDSGAMRAAGRGYHADDLPLLRNQGVAAGYGSVLVLALYINSPQSLMLYRHPHYLWLLCPLLLYWISRAWMKTHRGLMHDDPIVFALRDIPSLTVGVLMAAAVAIAALL